MVSFGNPPACFAVECVFDSGNNIITVDMLLHYHSLLIKNRAVRGEGGQHLIIIAGVDRDAEGFNRLPKKGVEAVVVKHDVGVLA